MKYEVKVSDQADYDLRRIFDYIAVDLQSPESASGQLGRLEKQILSLDMMPERYRQYEKEPPQKKEFAGSEVSGSAIFYFTRFYCAFYFSRWDSINSFFFTRNGVQLLP